MDLEQADLTGSEILATEQRAPRQGGGLLRALGGPRRELLLGVAVAVVSMVPIAYFARNYWFRDDNFVLLADRQLGSLNDLFRPHRGHWLTWTVLFSRGVYRVAGMDYWPWWYIPRLVGHAAVAFLIWRTILHRGADRVIAFGTYVALLVLAVSYFQDALTVANYVVYPCIVIAALLVSEVARPQRRHLVVVAICLVAGVMANGYGNALLLAIVVVAAVRHRFRLWLPALIPAALAFVAWYLWYRTELPHPKHGLSAAFVPRAIGSSFVVVRTAVQNTLGLPLALAVPTVAAVAGLLVWLAYRRRLDMFDAIIALTFVFVLGILAWGRTTQADEAENVRYGYAVVLLLTLLVIPHLKLPDRRATRTAAVVLLVAVVAFNALSLRHRLDDTADRSQNARQYAETTAALIASGEPFSDVSNIGFGVDPWLVQRLVARGWRARGSTDPVVVDYVRARMRFVVGGSQAHRAADAPGHVAPAARGLDRAGCLRVGRPTTVLLLVTGAGAFKVDQEVELTWRDRFGIVRDSGGPAVVALARPRGPATVTVRTGSRPTTICMLRPLGRRNP